MNGNLHNPALLRAYPYLAGNQLQPSQVPPLNFPPAQIPTQIPSQPTVAPPIDTNSCERLIHVARSMRAKPVYQIKRIGGEDHLPLFKAVLLLTPQNYNAEGVGGSKMAARRVAAANMINLISDRALGGQPCAGGTNPGATSLPAPPKSNGDEKNTADEMEEGELDSDCADDESPPHEELFFVDRDPDPQLEKEAQDEGLLEDTEGPSDEKAPPGSGVPKEVPQGNAPEVVEQEDVPAGRTASVVPDAKPEPIVVKTEEQVNALEQEEESQRVPKRSRTKLEDEPVQQTVEESAPQPMYSIPPRKRTKSLPRELPMRLRILLLCDYTEDVMKSLKALAEANLFVDLSIHMFSTVELPKYILLGKSVAVEVEVLPERARKSRTAVLGRLVFAAGAKSEEVWVERAKHIAKGHPQDLSPRVIVLYDDPALEVIKLPNVIDVMRPSDDLIKHVTEVLDKAKVGL